MHCGMLENIRLISSLWKIGNNIIGGNRGKEFSEIRK